MPSPPLSSLLSVPAARHLPDGEGGGTIGAFMDHGLLDEEKVQVDIMSHICVQETKYMD